MGDSVPPSMTDPADQRSSERIEVGWSVDCETEDTFLFASIANISDMGVFVRTETPYVIGTYLSLRFTPRDGFGEFVLSGRVKWVNEMRPFHDNINPGMGVMILDLTPEDRERLVDVIRTIAYLRPDAAS